MRQLAMLLAWVVIALSSASARASDGPRLGPVRVGDAFDEAKLGKHMMVAYDPDATATVQDAISGAMRFSSVDADAPGFGYRSGAEWARFVIEDVRGDGSPLYLAQNYAQTDRLDVFWLEGERLVSRTLGDHVPPSDDRVLARVPTVKLPAGSRTVYVRMESNSSHQMPLSLHAEASYERGRWQDLAVQALYFGAVIMIALYNLVLWLAMRWRAYGWYVGFLASMMSFIGALNGFAYVLAPSAPGWVHDVGVPLGAMGAAPVAVEFLVALVGREAYSPRLVRGLRIASAASGVLGALGWALARYAGSMRVLTLTSPALIVALIAVTVPVARRGNRAARLFLSSWGVFLVGSVVNALRMRGTLPTNAFTANTMQVGAALEALLLSIALADRTKALEREARTNAEIARAATERALEEQERTNRELKRLDKLKDEFLANTSHELRTPLHGILGLTEAVLVASPTLDGPARDRLGMVLASGRRLAALVNDILDFSKLRHHSLALRVKTVELAQAVKLAITIAEPLVGERPIRLRAEIPDGVRVRVDENRLQQILTNLIGNAVKFTERGEVVVRGHRAGARVFVSVHDTGIGIPEDALGRIFESFEQADGSTARQFGGTGLGLAVTRKLVELHGGSIAVSSAVGEGSTFTFDVEAASASELEAAGSTFDELGSVGALPASVRYVDDPSAIAISPQSSEAPVSAAAPMSAPSSAPLASLGSAPLAAAEAVPRRGHLLVADDDPVNVEVLRAQLEPAGYRVTVARDGREALEALAREGTFDGVLLDVMMPKMTGPEAAEQMRAEHPHGTLPILMLTAKSRPEDAIVGLRAGASDYVGKPFHREELLQRLDGHVQAMRTARAFRRFVPSDFLQLLGAAHFEELRAGVGQRHDLTVLFADIRGFTSRSEQLGPEGTFAFVNGCLQRFEPVVRAHGGFVDKFIGDAVMAIFPGEATRAVEAAARLQAEVASFNAAHPRAPMPLAIGIGVHRGPVILGTVGVDDRLEVTVIGDAVNVAARLEALTKRFGVGALASREIADSARVPGEARCIGVVHVRGRREPIELFELLACSASEGERAQKIATRAVFARGLAAWRAGRMDEASIAFEAARRDAPLDGVAAIYAEEATRLLRDGVPASFDGDLG